MGSDLERLKNRNFQNPRRFIWISRQHCLRNIKIQSVQKNGILNGFLRRHMGKNDNYIVLFI